MFKGDQFHQFIASSRETIPQLSLSYPHPLHGSPNSNSCFPVFDSYITSSSSSHHHQHQQVAFQSNSFLHPFHEVQPPPTKSSHHHEEADEEKLMEMNLEAIERQRIPVDEAKGPWSSDEVLALLRIRSSLENWFPEFTWEHISRKLADFGFKRSPEKCKEKFEEESRYFNNISNNNFNKSNNCRVFGELEELYNEGDGDSNNSNQEEEGVDENSDKIMDQPSYQEIIKQQETEVQEDKVGQDESRNQNGRQNQYKASGEDRIQDTTIRRDWVVEKSQAKRKRRRSPSQSVKRFEMFKGYCEGVVKKLLAKQEEMHVKLLEDMVRRDVEKAAREEEWKRQEMDRIDKDLELRAQEQVLASDRQATIIKFISKFTQSSSTSASAVEVPGGRNPHDNNQLTVSPIITSSLILAQNPNNFSPQTPISPCEDHQVNAPTLSIGKAVQNPNLENEPQTTGVQRPAISSINDKDDTSKRWPREEVLALINLRCSLSNNDPHQDKESGGGSVKGPLWERISKRMLELGYRRNAKRCKEKWENINKYFRKTKDLNKKRSVDSRTCPYFHQLDALYGKGTLVSPAEGSKSDMKEAEESP